jgi:inorganic pyrophosphatase
VPTNDPAWERVADIHDVAAELRNEIEHFFQVYKDLERHAMTETRGYGNRSDAEQVIAVSRRRAASVAEAAESRT